MRASTGGVAQPGQEVLCSGLTGDQIACDVFVGLNYYGRLKHMVADKVNVRLGGEAARGPIDALTRQPVKGRGQRGGLRVGEMEVSAVTAHGLGGFLKESLMERSDGHLALVVDAESGLPARAANASAGALAAHTYGDARDWVAHDFAVAAVPHAFRVLQHELLAMAVDTRVRLDRGLGDEDYGPGSDNDDGDEPGDGYGGSTSEEGDDM